MKLNGFRKYWDGYDNQPIVWIEDPGAFDTRFNVDDVNAFKMLISTGSCLLLEVKYGTVQFDSYLVIVTSNVAPWDLAQLAGPTAHGLANFDPHALLQESTYDDPYHLVDPPCANHRTHNRMDGY